VLLKRALLALAYTAWCGARFVLSGPRSRSAALTSWSRRVLDLFRIRIQWPRELEMGSGARVVIANHVSTVDIFVLASLGRPTVFLGKDELAHWPVLGSLFRASGMVFVKRDCLYSRGRALLKLQEWIQRGFDVVIFPEGTTSEDGPRRKTHSFHSGALRLSRMESVPIQLFHLDYNPADKLAWVGEATLWSHLKDLFSPKPKLCRIRSTELKPIRDRQDQRAKLERIRRYLLEGGSNTISVF
jgi:1-acyl-sn-glycerol-3-phosphate acyltransferase